MTNTTKDRQYLEAKNRVQAVRQTLANHGKSPVQTIIGEAFKYACEVITLWLFIMVVFMICLSISGA